MDNFYHYIDYTTFQDLNISPQKEDKWELPIVVSFCEYRAWLIDVKFKHRRI